MAVQQLLTDYLTSYGYLLLFFGTFLEGEAVLVLAGYFAFQGNLSLPGVLLTAWAGSFLGDQFYFFLGRWRGKQLLGRFPGLARSTRRAVKLIDTYGSFVAVISRYTYGLRIVLPIMLGMTSLSRQRFLVLNLLSAFSWASIFSCIGFVFGKSASLFIEDLERHEPLLIVTLLAVFALLWLFHALQAWRVGRPARQRLRRMKLLQLRRAAPVARNVTKREESEKL